MARLSIGGEQEKQLYWVGTSKNDISGFPSEAKQDLGHALHEVQRGRQPAHCRYMAQIGPGTYEVIATHTGREGLDHRVFYVAKFREAVYVLHAFEKKSQKTSRADLVLGEKRYKEMLELRRRNESRSRRRRR